MSEIIAQVTFMLSDPMLDVLRAKAREIDLAEGDDVPEEYTLEQALQVVWHLEPEWLHKHALIGWTLDKAFTDDGWRNIWPGPAAETPAPTTPIRPRTFCGCGVQATR